MSGETESISETESKFGEEGTLIPPSLPGDETEDEEETGELIPSEPSFAPDPIKATPPKNPSIPLYEHSQSLQDGQKLGCSKITVLAEYNAGVDYDVYAQKDTTTKTYYLFLPCRADLSRVTYSVTHKDGSVSGPYTVDLSDEKIHDNERVIGNNNSYVIKAMQSNLPTVMVQVDEQYVTVDQLHRDRQHQTFAYGDMITTVTDEVARENGWVTRYASQDVDPEKYCSLDIRGRGNNTWNLAKKPYQIRTENDIDLLGMGLSGTYALMANYHDATGIRTQLAMDLGTAVGVDYTTAQRQVDFFLNGVYKGMYTLTEKVEVAPNRVEIDKKRDILFEVDQHYEEQGEYGLALTTYDSQCRFRVHSPDAPKTLDASKQLLLDAIDALFSGDETRYLQYFDPDSWARAWIVQIYSMNSDAYHGSFYFYYSSDDKKLHACCPWDFDWAFGVTYGADASYWDPAVCDFSTRGICGPMMQYPSFVKALVKAYYEEGGKEAVEAMPALVKHYAEENRASAMMNTIAAAQYYYPSTTQTAYPIVKNYDEAVDFLYTICSQRLVWLDARMQSLRQQIS